MAVCFVKSTTMAVKSGAALVLALTLSVASSNTVSAQLVDSKVNATYHIKYNGIELGKLRFNSTVKGRSYIMESNTKLSVPLLGSIFKSLSWRGVTRTTGTVRGDRPKPDNYYFAFSNGKKSGKVNMTFANSKVSRVESVPNKKMGAEYVRVKNSHLKRVMDPMSAIMLISRKGNSHRSACARNIPIYDGKQRFNLKLSYKRSVRVKRSQSGGYAGPVIICRVRYQPVSGYKPHKKDVKFMAKTRGIELWLMPLPKSRNYAPYRFVLPLPVGTAEANLARFDIRNGSGRQIALVR